MSERTLVDYVLQGMKGRWECPVKHADGFTLGISDLSAWIAPAGNIFIELKDLPHWPTRPETPINLDYTEEQQLFTLKRRGYLFLRVGREYFLFDHHAAARLNAVDAEGHLRGKKRALDLCAMAAVKWEGSVDWRVFEKMIRMAVR